MDLPVRPSGISSHDRSAAMVISGVVSGVIFGGAASPQDCDLADRNADAIVASERCVNGPHNTVSTRKS